MIGESAGAAGDEDESPIDVQDGHGPHPGAGPVGRVDAGPGSGQVVVTQVSA